MWRTSGPQVEHLAPKPSSDLDYSLPGEGRREAAVRVVGGDAAEKYLGPEPARVEVGTRHSEAPAPKAGVPDIAPRLSRSSGGGHATLKAERIGSTESARCDRPHFENRFEN